MISKNYVDFTSFDLRQTIQYIKTYGSDEPYMRRKDDPVSGVIMRSNGELRVFGKQSGDGARYMSKEVPLDDDVWKQQPTEGSTMMGLPLLVRKLPPNPDWDYRASQTTMNQLATHLNRELRTRNTTWAWASDYWQNEVGNVLVVRADGKDISPQQVNALAKYFRKGLTDTVTDILEECDFGNPNYKVKKQFAEEWLCWKKFEEWFAKFEARKMVKQGDHWKNVESPFAI